MDPNPKSFPILSYILSRLHSSPPPPPSDDNDDIELQLKDRLPSQPDHHAISIFDRLPHLHRPHLISAMTSAVSDVSATRSILNTLGHRPDHETLDLAKLRISQIDSTTDPAHFAKAEKEKAPYVAIVKLDEMFENYEKLLREAEERLMRIYRDEEGKAVEEKGKGVEEEMVVAEEVEGIVREAAEKGAESLDLAGKLLRVLPDALWRMRGLVKLNLANNLLEVIPDAIAGLEHLEELRLSSNLLVSLPDSIGLLLNLKILDVSGNKLRALPDSISNCRSLLELDASYNELAYLPTHIGLELVNLQKLWVHLNKLRSLPTSICEMRSLRLLDAHFNELRGLPYAIGKLSNLESLNISSNFSDMRELPATFSDLMNLQELDLSNNQIHALPDTFGRLEKLTKLNLDQNPLVVPPTEIVNQGVEAVKMYMSKRRLDILLEEERKSQAELETPKAGWLTRSTSWLSTVVSGVSGYMGSGDRSPRDPYLDQQL